MFCSMPLIIPKIVTPGKITVNMEFEILILWEYIIMCNDICNFNFWQKGVYLCFISSE